MSFADLGLSKPVLSAVSDAGYSEPTPIQGKAIPTILMGRDILGCAQTGTGKTASFTLPMIDILANGRARARMPRTLILEPTRELATQVAENFDTYGKYNKLNKALIIGGSSMADQIKLLDRGVDVLIATPGRLLDLFERGGLLLSDVKILVIDEADRMLDMGFIPDIEKIVTVIPKIRQTLFFSATMPPEIKRLADVFLLNPKEITVSPPSTLGTTISHNIVMIDHKAKRDLTGLQKKKRAVLRKLIKDEKVKNALIFCNRKKDIDILNKSFLKHGYNSATLHGDMVQSSRTLTMKKFKANEYDYLICSDVAARGLDIDELSHVFNFDVPMHPEDYVHRIGRTGRAGKKGRAISLAWKEDKKYIISIEKLTGQSIPQLNIEHKEGTDTKLGPKPNNKNVSEPDQNLTEKIQVSDKDAIGLPSPRKKTNVGENGKGGNRNHKKIKVIKQQPEIDQVNEGNSSSDDENSWGSHIPAFLMRPVK
jgi:superfamily II DNA/RNA helicase